MPKVEVLEIDFPDEVLLKLALAAHERDLTLNQFVSNILRDKLYEEKDRELREREFKVRLEEAREKTKRYLENGPDVLTKAKAKHPEAFGSEPSTLKVGDRVRVLPVPPEQTEYRPKVGTVGNIEDVDLKGKRGSFQYRVGSIWYRRDELELVE